MRYLYKEIINLFRITVNYKRINQTKKKMDEGTSDNRQINEDNFSKTPVPIKKSPNVSPSIRSMTQTVIVSLHETVTHDITYGKLLFFFISIKIYKNFACGMVQLFILLNIYLQDSFEQSQHTFTVSRSFQV